MEEEHTPSVSAHYDQDDIAGQILGALRDAGRHPAELTIDDLAPADEVHTRGREATIELCGLTEFSPGLRVVDVGAGVGGPARYLATRFGCDVTGVDLTPSFCRAATELTAAVGLTERVRFHCASALEMPLDDAAFDLALTVQMQMNVADKAALYREIARVLVPGGRLVCQEIVAGEGGELRLPVPWASEPDHSHLVPPAALREAILGAGFEEVLWRDITAAQQAWTLSQADREPPRSPPPVGIHMVLGPDAVEKRRNSSRCLMEGRIGFVQGVFRKTSG